MTRMNFRILRIHPRYDFLHFSRQVVPNDCSQKIIESHVKGELVKIRDSYHFYDFYFKNDNLGLEIKILKFLRIQPFIMHMYVGVPFLVQKSV